MRRLKLHAIPVGISASGRRELTRADGYGCSLRSRLGPRPPSLGSLSFVPPIRRAEPRSAHARGLKAAALELEDALERLPA
ncbi:hypothetical protein DPEC_G00155280 [Dallia pectoralis]|uniref:Uncharacterized protein n=1 Tax=Dallia pectoralis TaxID=75939 RepID=A0ACC2GKS1_DALPE|nr:hypothetical protein DPEC_G00155280 [Dallia pectoralis]